MDKLCDGQGNGGLESQDAKRSLVELDVLDGRFVRSVIGSNGVDRAIRQPVNQRLAIFASTQRGIHLEARIVSHVFVDEREMVGSDFAGHAQALLLGEAHLRQRSFCGQVCNMQTRTGKFRDLHVARYTDRFGSRRHSG
jgi:hypothetical protein